MSFSYICVKKKENTPAIANEWRRFSESSPKRSAFKCTLWRGSTQWPLTITVVLLESTYLSFDYAVWQIKLQKREYACVNAGRGGAARIKNKPLGKTQWLSGSEKCPRATIHHAASQTHPASSTFRVIDETRSLRNLALFLKHVTDVNQADCETLRVCFRLFTNGMFIPQACRCYAEHLIMGWRRVRRRRSVVLKHAAARKTRVQI